MKQPPWTIRGDTSWGSTPVDMMKELRRNRRCLRPIIRSVGIVLLVVLSAPTVANAAPVGDGIEAKAANLYANVSDEKLTEIAASWDDLDADERQALISEVKMRMARQGRADLRVPLQRRYGEVVRRGTITIKIRKVPRGQVAQGRQRFGFGFEQRSAQADATQPPAQAQPEQTPPVVKVTDPD